ncbi:hypothetical protein [Arsukibacterium sp.]|uniref:hypothetical protein n=1 Tax=Arsukibacterium sp. TaxID=1977258 RepID=UPI00299E2A5C|nr:hypothetical protein [Arsukibacterium sp.]MDX1678547.1 hypothetical protein [Arsukibacterium sp.]
MKKMTTNITGLIIASALFASSAVMADSSKQPVTAVQLDKEVAKELSEVKKDLVQELQQQLTDSIKQQVSNAVSNIAGSVKALLP